MSYYRQGPFRPGTTVTFEMDDGQGGGAFLVLSTAPAIVGSPCGIPAPFGEILIGLGPGNVAGALFGRSTNGSPVRVQLAIPPDPSLVDRKLWGQGALLGRGRGQGGRGIALTNGVEIEIGAP